MSKYTEHIKKAFMPITIMCVPHSSGCTYRFRIPLVAIISVCALSIIGAGYIYAMLGAAFKYEPTAKELQFYKTQFAELESTISSLSMADKEFRNLFALDTKEEVLDSMQSTDSGSLDMELLRKQINKTIDGVAEIRDYMSEARDLYMATPLGLPVEGWTTSRYGYRTHPIKGTRDHHSGMDISARPGTPVRVTADGIVSFSGRSGANGNLVAVEHGFGYSTYYAHNKMNAVSVGQVVKRGDIISYLGSTGSSTGPHVHYEVWKNEQSVDPQPYVKGGNWDSVLKKRG